MREINLLKEILEIQIWNINQEINRFENKKDIILLEEKLSKKLGNNFRNIVLCRDEEIYRLIEEKQIDINIEDYESMKLIISNESIFSGLDFVPPQYIRAREQAEKIVSQINSKVIEGKENLANNQDRINNLRMIYSKCQELYQNIKDNELKTPIIDVTFVLNLLESVRIEDKDKIEIISTLIKLNNKAFERETNRRIQPQQVFSVPIQEPITTNNIQDTEKPQPAELEPKNVIREQYNKQEISQPTEDELAQEESEYISDEVAKGLLSEAESIIKNNKYKNLMWITAALNETLKEAKATADLLRIAPADEDLIEDYQQILKNLDELIIEYNQQISYIVREETKNLNGALLRPGEKFRIIYLMHSLNNKQVKNLSPEDFFEAGLESFFEQDFIGSNNVDNYKRISKLLNELRQGILINVGKHEHKLTGILKDYSVKKGTKVRIAYKQINDDTVLILGYSEQFGKNTQSATSYTTIFESRELLYGGKIEEIIEKINSDPQFREMAYRMSRQVDDRIIDILDNRRTKGIKKIN